MGEKQIEKSSRKRKSQGVEDMAQSQISDENQLQEDQWGDELLENVEFLTKKRSGNRVYALENIQHIMRKHCCREVLLNHYETILVNVFNSLERSTSSEEAILSLNVLSLIAITFGGSSDQRFTPLDLTTSVVAVGIQKEMAQKVIDKMRSIFTFVEENASVRR